MMPEHRFARRVFAVAGTYGLIVTAPLYFMEARIARESPPAITHPEYYYGFAGVVIAWQLAFLLLARDPVRLRPLMPVAVLEKLAFGLPALVLYARHRLARDMLAFGLIDLVLGAFFLAAWVRTGGRAERDGWADTGLRAAG